MQYACQYTEQIKITDCIKDVHTAIFTGHMGSENSSCFRLARKRMQQAFLLHHLLSTERSDGIGNIVIKIGSDMIRCLAYQTIREAILMGTEVVRINSRFKNTIHHR